MNEQKPRRIWVWVLVTAVVLSALWVCGIAVFNAVTTPTEEEEALWEEVVNSRVGHYAASVALEAAKPFIEDFSYAGFVQRIKNVRKCRRCLCTQDSNHKIVSNIRSMIYIELRKKYPLGLVDGEWRMSHSTFEKKISPMTPLPILLELRRPLFEISNIYLSSFEGNVKGDAGELRERLKEAEKKVSEVSKRLDAYVHHPFSPIPPLPSSWQPVNDG